MGSRQGRNQLLEEGRDREVSRKGTLERMEPTKWLGKESQNTEGTQTTQSKAQGHGKAQSGVWV